MSLMDNFPGTPRGVQEEVVKKIEEAFIDEGKKFVICQAPTGSGKSFLGATVALSTKSCDRKHNRSEITPKSHFRKDVDPINKFGGYILTTTKQLQDQYQELFPDCSVLKGKVNYECAIDPICNAGHAKCVYLPNTLARCSNSVECDYINAYSDAMKNNFSVLSYSMFLSLPAILRNKEVLICDEASEMEDALVSHFSSNIKYKYLDFLGASYTPLNRDDSQSGYLWVCEVIDNLKKKMPKPQILNRADVSKHTINRAKGIKELVEKLKLLTKFWSTAEFVVEISKEGVHIEPLKVNKLSDIMFKGIDKVFLLSATVINHSKFADSLGIPKDNYKFIDVKSDFNPKKSPIYVASAKFDMTYRHIDRSIVKMVDAVVELSEIHEKDNGVIHTHNFKITNAIRDAVRGDDRFLFRDKFATNEDILREHFNREDPTVLVSPSLAFGTSLDNEHGRFQIVSKLPYLPMSSKRISTLSKRDYDWYQMKMWIKFIQMCGRCTRSKDDHSATYIFDKSFITAIGRYESKLPTWFKDRLI